MKFDLKCIAFLLLGVGIGTATTLAFLRLKRQQLQVSPLAGSKIGTKPNFRTDVIATSIAGQRSVTSIPEEVSLVLWDPTLGEPLISAANAIQAARSAMIGFQEAAKLTTADWNVTSMCLVPYDEKTWFWKIKFERLTDLPNGSGYLSRADEIEVGVMMNGRSVVPTLSSF